MTKKEMEQKEKLRKIVDRTIEIILVIIIIMLLLHNCSTEKKKNSGKTPNGNVNIIEIKCDDKNSCDVDIDEDSDDIVIDENGQVIDNSSNTNSKKSKKSKKKKTPSSDSDGDNPSGDDSSDDDIPDIDDDGEFRVFDREITWQDSSELKIFTNSMYTFEDKIAPECSNTYQFVVKNSTDYNLKYTMNFSEVNPYHINMKYKLKKNNSYVISNYVSYDQLNLSDQLLNSKKNDRYYLEWKWVSSDNDTTAGVNQADYKLTIDVEAESVS